MSAPPSPSQEHEFAAADRKACEWFIVLNPGSGQQDAHAHRDLIRAVLSRAGVQFRFVPVGAGGMLVACQLAAQWAKSSNGLLVAGGGDGTLNCAAQAAMQHGCTMAVIPLGTFNLFARDHGMPQDVEEAVQAILHARPTDVQVGLVNQRVFLANAAVGLYPRLLEDREVMKEQLGRRTRWIALLSSLKSLVEWRWELRLDAELDGHVTKLRTPSLFVSNNRTQLARIGIDDGLVAQVGQGRLAALITHPLGLWDKLKLACRAAFRRLGGAREVDSLAIRSLALGTRFARKMKVATDGEVQWMDLPLRFTVSPRPLRLMVPTGEGEGAR